MSGLNLIIQTGNLGDAPENKTTQNGETMMRFSIAVNEGKDAKPTWFNVSVFGRQAEGLAKCNLTKGTRVTVSGRFSARPWEKDGKTGTALQITARDVVLHGAKQTEQSAPDPVTDDIPF